MRDAVIVAAHRSPIGRAGKGSLATLRPDDLAAQIVRAALAGLPGLEPPEIDDLVLGCAQPAGESGFNIARVVAVLLGHDHLPGTTVNRYCASSLQAARMAFHSVAVGEAEIVVAGGVETASRFDRGTANGWPDTQNPVFAEAGRRSAATAAGGAEGWTDPREKGWLPDLYLAMGLTAENVARVADVSRADMDHFAARSQQRAVASIDDGFWARDITPVVLADGTEICADDGPRRGVTFESLSTLKPVFREDGRVTAGNCCPLNDGAAALVITSADKARDMGWPPLARIVSSAVSGLSPEIMGLGPVEATRRALSRAGMTLDDVDLVEMNEAFAAQVLAAQRELGLDMDRLNTHGGAIALGHPFGMTGARLIRTLITALRADDGQVGVATMCIGGGMGMAMVVERLS
ncbi:acetyl-CoA C-acetyltransferase [Amycolatopsis sp. K13G38]|uniref:Acetyl-CoA C-acetyltransferase n=1 Tax=Amycolatopsis acididurans TaxID=2724524 RepID=A0ABX1J9F6_9PSEU|nr:acetyl-CoA C-acetyltransferase [Amycolatopsis acididurans]NKQ56179.1 acetyl-CoA C-acetyltransferase [Amycolatopsis acididurans]